MVTSLTATRGDGMNMFEEAEALRGMLAICALTQCEFAKKIGVSQSYVANKLRLLNFTDEIRAEILDAKISERHARTLLKLKDEPEIKRAIAKIKAMDLNTAASEVLINGMLLEKAEKNLADAPPHERITKFEKLIENSINLLKESGVNARQSVDVIQNKKYITICIYE